MSRKVIVTIIFLLALTAMAGAQTDLRIKKKIHMSIPGMENMPANMPSGAAASINDQMNRTSTVYIKGSAMRTDMDYKEAGIEGVVGKIKTRTMTYIQKCDKGELIHFTSSKKKYYVEKPGSSSANAKAKHGGYVNVSVEVTDTGERMKLFGYNSRHLKQTITITPGENACQKSSMQMTSDGWYADIPTFSCSIKPDVSEMQSSKGCYDNIVYEMKGSPVTGIPLKENKTMSMDGHTITFQEEVAELVNTTLEPSLFEPPADYQPADSLAEAMKNDNLAAANANSNVIPPSQSQMPQAEDAGPTLPPTLAPPAAGVANANPVGAKKTGMIRIGVAQPDVQLGNDFQSQAKDPTDTIKSTLGVVLKADTVETFYLSSGLPEQEAKQNDCDYIIYTKVTRKKGGGMFGGMLPSIAASAVSMVVPMAGIVASAVMTTASLSGGFKSKDEVGFEYTLNAIDGSAKIPKTTTKQKAKKDGDDVLTPQIQQAATAVLAAVTKKNL